MFGNQRTGGHWRSFIALGFVVTLAACGSGTSSAPLQGHLTFYVPSSTASPLQQLVVGPQGNVWYIAKAAGANGSVTESVGTIKDDGTQSVVKTFSSQSAVGGNFVVDDQGNLWYFPGNTIRIIERLSPDGTLQDIHLSGDLTQPFASVAPELAFGPGGKLWAVLKLVQGYAIASITTTGVVQVYPLPESPDNIAYFTAGSDASLWLLESFSTTTFAIKLVRMTTEGVVSSFTIMKEGSFDAFNSFSAGADGTMWLAQTLATSHSTIDTTLYRITAAGSITTFALAEHNEIAGSLALGPDNNEWYVQTTVSTSGSGSTASLNLVHWQIVEMTPNGSILRIYPIVNQQQDMVPNFLVRSKQALWFLTLPNGTEGLTWFLAIPNASEGQVVTGAIVGRIG